MAYEMQACDKILLSHMYVLKEVFSKHRFCQGRLLV